MTDYEKAVQELKESDELFNPFEEYNPDFQDLCYDIVKKFEEFEEPDQAVKAIMECFERQATDNFGIHAELFVFIEGLDRNELEKEVLESIQRKPVPQTVWLIKKFINSSDDKEKWINILKTVAADENLDTLARETAEMFLSV